MELLEAGLKHQGDEQKLHHIVERNLVKKPDLYKLFKFIMSAWTSRSDS